MTRTALRQFWSNWVYDFERAPTKWERHPHCAFKIIARLAGVSLGSMAPLGLILLQNEVREGLGGMFDEFWGGLAVVLVIVGTWVPSFICAVSSAQETLRAYVYVGSIPPAHLTVLFLCAQGIV